MLPAGRTFGSAEPLIRRPIEPSDPALDPSPAFRVLAHGLGGRTDLPLDALGAITGGGVAVLASFAGLTLLWRRPRLRADGGQPLPGPMVSVVGSVPLRAAARLLVLAAAVLVVAVALFGPRETEANLAPWALYITFWVGLVPASVLLGPVWRQVNPLRTLHTAVCRLTGRDRAGRRPLPTRIGYWPAAGWLAGFVWVELVAPGRADPRLVGALIIGYAAVNLAAAWWYGRDWFAHGDGFEVYSSLLALLAPIGRRGDGRWVLRTPLTGLVGDDTPPGRLAVACVIIGSTFFDGVTRTVWWRRAVAPDDALAGSIGLAVAVAAVTGLYLLALRAGAALSGHTVPRASARFSATLLPIALGYTVAHYFSFFLLEGQMTVILAGDPFGTGLNLLGTDGNRIDYGLVGPALVALVQINAIVLGHIGATIAAHDQALRLYPAGSAVRGQIPVAAVMVVLTCAGLGSLLSG